VRPPRTPLSRKHLVISNAVNRARQCNFELEYQAGIRATALAIADEVIVPGERASFLLACGLDAFPLDG